MVAVPVGVMRLLGCPFDGPWFLVCECACWRSFVVIVGVPCLSCSLAVPGVWSFLVMCTCISRTPHDELLFADAEDWAVGEMCTVVAAGSGTA